MSFKRSAKLICDSCEKSFDVPQGAMDAAFSMGTLHQQPQENKQLVEECGLTTVYVTRGGVDVPVHLCSTCAEKYFEQLGALSKKRQSVEDEILILGVTFSKGLG